MTRFEGPIAIKFAGSAPSYAERDLERLIARLRSEARIDIRRVPAEELATLYERGSIRVGDAELPFHWLSALIALPVIAYSGRPFFSSAAMALKNGR